LLTSAVKECEIVRGDQPVMSDVTQECHIPLGDCARWLLTVAAEEF
jgi:hypothetical protein